MSNVHKSKVNCAPNEEKKKKKAELNVNEEHVGCVFFQIGEVRGVHAEWRLTRVYGLKNS